MAKQTRGMRRKFVDETLPKTFDLLRNLKPKGLTPKRLAKMAKIQRPAAYRRLQELTEDPRFKDHVATKPTREGQAGPMSEEYFFV